MWICQRCQPETKCSSYTAIFKMKSWWEVGEQASMNYPWPTSWLAYRLPTAWLSFLLSFRWIRSPQTLLRESSPLPLLSLLELRPACPGPLYTLPWITHGLLTFLPSTQVGWEAGWEEVCLSTWLEIEAQIVHAHLSTVHGSSQLPGSHTGSRISQLLFCLFHRHLSFHP